MNIYPPGAMTSTHSGNPICVACSIACLEVIDKEGLVENSARVGEILREGCEKIQKKYSNVLGCVQAKGLVAGIQVVKAGTKTPNPELALKINEKCYQKGLLMFAPVGIAGECIKIAPPLCITEEAMIEALQILEEACDECCG